jgi:3-dehydroquinate dehydratase-2
MEEYIGGLREKFDNIKILYFQSNHEGVLIDLLHKYGFDVEGIIFNAGAYTHSSIALRDAISAITVPVIELHISDTKNREAFRKHSYLTDVCVATIEGKGLQGYEEAIYYFLKD